MVPLNPRASGRFIASRSRHVTINQNGIKSTAKLVYDAVVDGSMTKSLWYSTHTKYPDRKAVDWCFVADLLNFSFWTSSNDQFQVTYQGKTETGYYGCCALINRAIDNGIQFTDCSVYGKLSLEELTKLFTADNGFVVPMIQERYQCLQEAAEILQNKFQGTFYTCVQSANGSAKNLLNIIVENFPCFRDYATYEDQEVSFLKRAQILVADVHSCLQGRKPADFSDIDSLTMFADYRVPQVLVYLGALEYSKELMDLLIQEKLLTPGCNYEVEIRGCSIECVEVGTKI